MTVVPEGALRFTLSTGVIPDEYEIAEYRTLVEEHAMATISRSVQAEQMAWLDAPVGKWAKESVPYGDDGQVWDRWVYRITGYAIPADSTPVPPPSRVKSKMVLSQPQSPGTLTS